MAIKNANEKGYEEAYEGDSVNLTYPSSDTRRGRVGHDVAQTIQSSATQGVVLKGQNKVVEDIIKNNEFTEGKAQSIDIQFGGRVVDGEIGKTLLEPHHNNNNIYDGLRIRKLTPKECWRLMGFSDEDFEKARQVNSDTQLYKQAGNSIVVDVLVAILKNLLTTERKEGDTQLTLF